MSPGRAPATSLEAGFLVASRWSLRGLGVKGVLLAAFLIVPVSVVTGGDPDGRRVAWIDLVTLLAPLFALAMGAYAFRLLRGAGRSAPLEGFPLRPFPYLVGQFAALGLTTALGAAMLILPGALYHSRETFFSVVTLERPVVEGLGRRQDGREWAIAPAGRIRWSLPDHLRPDGDWRLESRLRLGVVHGRGYPAAPVPLTVWGADETAAVRLTIESEAPFQVELPVCRAGGAIYFRCESPGVAITPVPHGTFLVGTHSASAASAWLKLWWVVLGRCLLLLAAAFTAALLVSPPIALLGALTLWLVGWTSRFLIEYTEVAGLPSIFAAWSGQADDVEPVTPWLHWLGDVLRLIPDLRPAVVSDVLAKGWSPPWGGVFTDVAPLFLAAFALAFVGAVLGIGLWRRRPGRIPGERGFS